MKIFSKMIHSGRLLALAVCVSASAQAFAQSAVLKGTVSDPSGAVVAGAAITAQSEANSASATSDSNGAFVLNGLKPGAYTVQISAPGFKSTSVEKVNAVNGQAASLAVHLTLAEVSTEVRVIDTTKPSGSYNVPTASMGPLGEVETLNTPYTLNVIPTNLMENQGSRTFSDAIKYMPFAQMEARGQMDVGRPQTRGFEGDVIMNSRLDGLNVIITTTYPMEMLDRIEVQSGLAGMYGPQDPSGMFNFVLKRPTAKQMAMVGVSVDSPSQLMIHGDFGGPITKYVGYRINALHQNGTGYVDYSHRRRDLFSASLDITPFEKTRLELNGSYYADHFRGFPGMFNLANLKTGSWMPAAMDPTRPGYGQPWGGQDLYTNTVSGNLHQGLIQNWHLTVGGLHQAAERILFNPTNTLAATASTTGAFTVGVNGYSWNKWNADSNSLHANGTLKTGWLTHQLVLGTNGFVQRNTTASGSVTIANGASNLNNPVLVAATFNPFGPSAKGSTVMGQALVFADTVTLAKRWSVNFIGSYNWIDSRSFSGGKVSSDIPDAGFTPAASLLYKPANNQSVYFTYASSLYAGDTAPTTGSPAPKNAGAVLPANQSKQYELGYKVQIREFQLTAAAYRMNRPYGAVDTDNYFKVIGNQVNDGLDFMAKGKLPYGFNVFGGFTWLDPQLQNTGDATTNGKQVVGVPRIQSNILLENKIAYVKGLSAQVNWHHTGDRAASTTNSLWAPGYDTVDLGARYEQDLKNLGGLTWRVSAQNVGNRFYWASIFPSGINGASTVGANALLGAPRTISASLQYRFAR